MLAPPFRFDPKTLELILGLDGFLVIKDRMEAYIKEYPDAPASMKIAYKELDRYYREKYLGRSDEKLITKN
jgi:hypothetical protein